MENDIRETKELLPYNPMKRLSFVNSYSVTVEGKNIFFSDEAIFHLNDSVNERHRFINATENTRIAVQVKTLRSPAITCWAVVSPDKVVTYELLDTMMMLSVIKESWKHK